jgi:galactonate dehydratase
VKITSITPFVVDAAWRNWVFLRVDTDDGLVGFGECTLEGREKAVVSAVADMSRQLIGRDPRLIRQALDVVTRRGYWESGPVISSAVGGIEIALWDILGKSLDAPLHCLLGGAVRSRIKVYANAWYFGCRTPEAFAAAALRAVEMGHRALKFDPFATAGPDIELRQLSEAIDSVAAVRQAIGPEVELMIEGHGRFNVPTAIRVGQTLEAFGVTFFEEPVPPGNYVALRQVTDAIRVSVAAGERIFDARDCHRALDSGAIAVLQADVIHIGGILQLMNVAAMAEAAMIPMAPHNASGPIATAATLHVMATIPNAFIQEMFHPDDASWRDAVGFPPIRVEDGYVGVPGGPGLGITLDERTIAEHPAVERDLHLFEEESVTLQPMPSERPS